MPAEQSKPDARTDEVDARGKAPIDLQIGEVIAGKYSIERLLGRGGMGTVWLCTHLGLHERVAVKVMSRQMADNDEVRARFAREARASAKIKSRYVARVYDTGEFPDGRPYLVMEYMEGETLGQALQVAGTMSLADTARILGQVGRGLARAHELGIVHRDIKPDNVFLAHTADDGVLAKVFDFGIVKVSEALALAPETTQEGALLGTPQYMSPEQVEGVAIDHRSDVYALGVMAFRMLTGRRLFPGESLSATLMKICNGPLPSLAELLPELPATVDAWFQRTCARDREARFPSALECVDALAAAAGIAGSPDVSLPPPAVGNVPAGGPKLLVQPLETPTTGISAVQRSTPATGGPPPSPESVRAASPRSRRAIVAIAATAIVGLLMLLVFSRGTHTSGGVEPGSMASAGPASPPPLASAPVAAAPPAPAVAPDVAPSASASAQPDASTRPGSRGSPPRRPGHAPSKGETPPPSDGIHDVGY